MSPSDRDPSVRARFSAAAGTYDEHAGVQREAAAGILALIPDPPPERILEVGCGTGVFTALLLERFPSAEVLAIDVSERMVLEARRRLAGCARVHFEVADALSFRTGARFPLIASSSSLHWARPLADAVRNLAAHLEPGGRLAFSIMLEGTLEELHALRIEVAPRKPPAARLPTDASVRDAVKAADLAIEAFREETRVARAPSAAEVFRALRRQGLTGGAYSRAEVPLNRGEIEALRLAYDARHGGPEGVPATYRVGYVLAGWPE